MNCARFQQILDEVLLEELPSEAREHGEGCEHCGEELELRRRLGSVLDAFGRAEPPPGFFGRQQASILSRLQEEAAVRSRLAWHAPAGSLVLLAAVVAAYSFFGLEGCFEGFMGGPEISSTGTDPLRSVLPVFGALLALGVYMVGRDAEGSRAGAGVRSSG